MEWIPGVDLEEGSNFPITIDPMDSTTKRGFLLAKGWIQAVLLVSLFGFFVLGFLAYNTYTGEPPIPGKVVDPNGQVLFTRADIMAGQGTFLETA